MGFIKTIKKPLFIRSRKGNESAERKQNLPKNAIYKTAPLMTANVCGLSKLCMATQTNTCTILCFWVPQ